MMMWKYFGILVVCCIVGTNAGTGCLSVLSSKECSAIQELGEKISDKINDLINVLEESLYRGIEEGTKILTAGTGYLKKEVTSNNVKVSSPGQAPIETADISTMQTTILNAVKKALIVADTKMIGVVAKAVKETLGDDLVTKLVFKLPAVRRKRNVYRRSDSEAEPTDLGNTLDGIIENLVPDIKAILTTMDKTTKTSIRPFHELLASSLKFLLNKKVDIDFDQVKVNLEKYLSETESTVIQSILTNVKQIIVDTVKLLQALSDETAKFKSDSAKLQQALKPASDLVSDVITSAMSGKSAAGVMYKIKQSIGILQLTFLKIKALTS